MTQSTQRPRLIGLDLVRSLAILFVISGHFFAFNTPFRDTIFGGGQFSLAKCHHSALRQWRSTVSHADGIPQLEQNAHPALLQRLHQGLVRLRPLFCPHHPVP